MHKLRILAAIALLAILGACAALPGGGTSAAPPRGTAPGLSQSDALPRAIAVDGDYVQAASGMVFPTAVGTFQRGWVGQYDQAGRDIGAGYFQADPPVALRVYVYPGQAVDEGGTPRQVAAAREAACRAERERLTPHIVSHANGRIVETRPISLRRGDRDYPGSLMVFELEMPTEDGALPVAMEVHLFCGVDGEWLVKYCVIHPRAVDARAATAAFLRDLPWTIAGAETGL